MAEEEFEADARYVGFTRVGEVELGEMGGEFGVGGVGGEFDYGFV